MSDVHLKRFEANSFMGIERSGPVIVDFGSARKGSKVLKLSGDQGTGKTSTITALMLLMGAAFNIDHKNFKNLKDEAVDVSLEFEYDGTKYKAEASATRMSLKSFYKEKWIVESSPKDAIRKMFGSLGVSPMFLKELAGKKQIQWFKDTFGDDAEASKKEQKLVADIEKKVEERKETNRELKAVKGWLDSNELYQNYEKSQEKFATPVKPADEKKKFEELSHKKDLYNQYINTQDAKRASLKDTQNSIDELEKKLAEAKELKLAYEESIEKGDKWLEENKSVVADFDKAQKEWLKLSDKMAAEKTWKEVLEKEKEHTKLLDESTTYDADIDKLRIDLLKLSKGYLPKVEGLEVKVKTSLTQEEEGVYYNGKTLAMLSESELWTLFADHIWPFHETRFVFCENVNSLGSDAISVLNKLAKDGAFIFASEMQRKKDHMEWSLTTKLD